MTYEVKNWGTQINRTYSQLNQLLTKYTTLKAAGDKLDKVNQMWSKNFKIMEVTFKQIQRNGKDLNVQSPKFV